MITIDQAANILDEFEKCGCRNQKHLMDLINQALEDSCPHYFIHNNHCAVCHKDPVNTEGTL